MPEIFIDPDLIEEMNASLCPGCQRLKTGDSELCAECEAYVDASIEAEVAAYFQRKPKPC